MANGSGGWPGPFVASGSLLFSVVLTFLGLTCVTFFIGRVIPIDPVLAIVGDKASIETYDRVRSEIGLDLPIPVQYWRYLLKVLHGDFGNSVITSQPVLQDLLRVFPATLELSLLALIIGVVLRHSARRDRRDPSWPLAGSGDPLRLADRLFDAGVLARPRRAARLLRQARLGRRARPARREL